MLAEPITLTFYQWIIALLMAVIIVSLIVGYLAYSRGLAYRATVEKQVAEYLCAEDDGTILWAYINDKLVRANYECDYFNKC